MKILFGLVGSRLTCIHLIMITISWKTVVLTEYISCYHGNQCPEQYSKQVLSSAAPTKQKAKLIKRKKNDMNINGLEFL